MKKSILQLQSESLITWFNYFYIIKEGKKSLHVQGNAISYFHQYIIDSNSNSCKTSNKSGGEYEQLHTDNAHFSTVAHLCINTMQYCIIKSNPCVLMFPTHKENLFDIKISFLNSSKPQLSQSSLSSGFL